MLTHPTREKLIVLKLFGMAHAFQEQASQSEIESLHFEERLGLLVDREMTDRENRRLQSRLKKARLRQAACVEDIDYRSARGLDKSLIQKLATGSWIRAHQNLILIGPTGTGKTYLASALAQSLSQWFFLLLLACSPTL